MTIISRKIIKYILAFAGGLLLLQASYYTWQVIAIGAAYKAKVLCSGVFVSHRSPQDILHEDLESILSMMDTKIDFERKSVTTYFPGVPSRADDPAAGVPPESGLLRDVALLIMPLRRVGEGLHLLDTFIICMELKKYAA